MTRQHRPAGSSSPNSPRWWRRFFTRAIDWTLFQHPHCLLYCAFELRIVAGDYILRPILDVNVRRHAFVLNCPTIVAREEAAARRDGRSTINESWRVCSVNQPAPRAFANQQANLSIVKHVRHEVAA